jgi:hypothetical protein
MTARITSSAVATVMSGFRSFVSMHDTISVERARAKMMLFSVGWEWMAVRTSGPVR